MIHQDPVYGAFQVEGILEALVQTPAFQRLKRIHQGGVYILVDPEIQQTRYEHSLGVMRLTQLLGGDLENQIAGLLHDISHTAFSHLVDYVLENEEEDYHDGLYAQTLQQPEIQEAFRQYGFQVEDFEDLHRFPMLEAALPALSTDRIDYTLRDLFHLGWLERDEIPGFLAGLMILDGHVVCRDRQTAQWFQLKYDLLILDYFQSRKNLAINLYMRDLLQKLFKEGKLELADFAGDDVGLMEKITFHLGDDWRKNAVKADQLVEIPEKIPFKQRKIDPPVSHQGKAIPLSEL